MWRAHLAYGPLQSLSSRASRLTKGLLAAGEVGLARRASSSVRIGFAITGAGVCQLVMVR